MIWIWRLRVWVVVVVVVGAAVTMEAGPGACPLLALMFTCT